MKHTLVTVELVEARNIHWNEHIRYERQAAMSDLLLSSLFVLKSAPEAGPYHLRLSQGNGQIDMNIHSISGEALETICLPVQPLRRLLKEYVAVCEAYYDAARRQHPADIETVDMGRRGLHNEGASLLRERLAGQVEVDFETARRLFTLVCVLNLREFTH